MESSSKKNLCLQPNQQTNRSLHFIEAEKRACIPFLHYKQLECDWHSQVYTIHDHDITLRIPEGAIPVGKKIRFEIAVVMYGPFIFEENMWPISPILWLCFKEDIPLDKPFQVILPHFLVGLTKEKALYHQVTFAKATHSEHFIEDGQLKYSFKPCTAEPYYASSGGKSYGVLVTKHCCFYCLQAKHTPELVKDASYCLSRIESKLDQHRSEIYFSATFFLSTCLKVLV